MFFFLYAMTMTVTVVVAGGQVFWGMWYCKSCIFCENQIFAIFASRVK